MTNDIYVKNKLLLKKKRELLDLQFKDYFIIFNEILKKKKKTRTQMNKIKYRYTRE